MRADLNALLRNLRSLLKSRPMVKVTRLGNYRARNGNSSVGIAKTQAIYLSDKASVLVNLSEPAKLPFPGVRLLQDGRL